MVFAVNGMVFGMNNHQGRDLREIKAANTKPPSNMSIVLSSATGRW